MFDKNKMTVEIGDNDIKILCGSRNNINSFASIETPKEAFTDDTIVDITAISNLIKQFIKDNNIKAKSVLFAIKGQDIVIRHIEIPIMDKEGIEESVRWEISQYLPEGGENHYSDYEIEEKINTQEKRACKLLVVSVPKEKIDKYMELANELSLKIDAVDIVSNCICRVFKNVNKSKRQLESVGIINIGISSSSITILKDGKLFIEREVPFGISNVAKAFNKDIQESVEKRTDSFLSSFSLGRSDEVNSFSTVNSMFDNMLVAFERVIQFYTSGKTKKSLDMLYVIGEGADIKNIDNYVEDYFSTDCKIVNSPEQIEASIKIPKDFNFRSYINTLGLMLRKD